MECRPVGYGEVGRILAEDLRKQDVSVAAYDIKLRSDQTGGALRDHAGPRRRAVWLRMPTLPRNPTSSSPPSPRARPWRWRRPAREAVKYGAWFLDFNSASPGAKQRAAALIDGAGGRYVEGAVMTSVPPYRIKVPLLLGGGVRPRSRRCWSNLASPPRSRATSLASPRR